MKHFNSFVTSSIILSSFCLTPLASGLQPGQPWERRTPSDVMLDEAKLAEFRAIVGGRGCIVRHGYLVYAWGEFDQPHDVASALKPLYSYLMMQALATGKLSSLDARVVDFWPDQSAVREKTDHKDQQLTFRHLGFQTACLGYREAPGSAFDYNDATMGFFWDTLINKVYGVPWDQAEAQVIAPLLSTPLQFQDGTPHVVQTKTGRFQISARDFCRFGLLFLHRGRWSKKQILREDLAVMSVTDPLPLTIPRTSAERADTIFPVHSIGGGGNQCDHNGGYSWMWWLNRTARDGELWFPDVPADFFACFGHGGQEGLAVLPSQDIVVSWIGKELHQDRARGNRAFRSLVDAVRR
jgi:CubicO group peptidase (beta-lactamase class C family)